MKNGKAVLKWINVIAFTILLLGGLNFLLMGLFGFDFYALIFGGASIALRVLYAIFGAAAVTLLTIVLVKGLKKPKSSSARTSEAAQTSQK